MRKRDYVKERLRETPARKKARAARNRARRKMGLKNGDPRQVDHKRPLSKGGTNVTRNLRVVAKSYNLRKGNRKK